MNMDPRLARRVAAVTGGMGGIGGGIVVALTRRQFDVVVCDRTIDEVSAENLTAQAAPAPGAQLSFANEDVGRAVATLAAGDLPFTTGVAVQVDGGMHIHQY
jgi:NAD(P)-dependent dehydrogenase (short-subunit alcohol dehydrogenase family)